MAEIQLEKAKTIIKEYRQNGFNASKALVKAGYKQSTATKGSKTIINNALKKIVKEEMNEIVQSSSSPRNKLLQMVGLSEQELMNEYMFVVKQNKDLTNKLKAMVPLLKTQGIMWEEGQGSMNPVLNLTVKNTSDNKPDNTIDTSVNSVVPPDGKPVDGSQDMAQQSQENDHVAQYTLLTTSDDAPAVASDNSVAISNTEKREGHDGGGVDLSTIGIKEV